MINILPNSANFRIDPAEQARMDERTKIIERFSTTIAEYFALSKSPDAEKQSLMAPIYAELALMNREKTLSQLDPRLQGQGAEKIFGGISINELNFAMSPREHNEIDIMNSLSKKASKFVADNTSPINRSKLADPSTARNQYLFQPNEVADLVWPEFPDEDTGPNNQPTN